MSKKKIKFIDLFSGAGGLGKGLEMAGLLCAGAIDHDESCAETHRVNFKNVPFIKGSVSKISPQKFSDIIKEKEKIDVVVGGPPCPTFSTIGRAKIKNLKNETGLNKDERNFLFRDFFRYVRFFKPKLILIENVPGFKKRYEGKIYKETEKKISECGMEIISDNNILNAADYGVPQIRKRMILVAVKKNIDFSYPDPLYSNGSLPFYKKYITVAEAISDLPKIPDNNPDIKMKYKKINKNSLSEFQKIMRKNIKDIYVENNRCRFTNNRAKKVFKNMKQGDKYADLPEEIQKILGYSSEKFGDKLKRLKNNLPSWTIIAHLGVDGYMYIHPTQNRTLSVREAARLQSFPDNFLFRGSMYQMYTQIGNAVPVLLAKTLGKSIIKSLN